MATERKPWPAWAANSYTQLRAYSQIAGELTEEITDIKHYNVYRTANMFLRLVSIGQKINAIAKEARLANKEDDQQWPKWASAAIETAWHSGMWIKSGAKHGLAGLNLDGQGENWAQVIKGLNTCIEHTHKLETAIKSGPPPKVNFPIDDLILTLKMGETTPNGWRRRNK